VVPRAGLDAVANRKPRLPAVNPLSSGQYWLSCSGFNERGWRKQQTENPTETAADVDGRIIFKCTAFFAVSIVLTATVSVQIKGRRTSVGEGALDNARRLVQVTRIPCVIASHMSSIFSHCVRNFFLLSIILLVLWKGLISRYFLQRFHLLSRTIKHNYTS